jgi:hypothetical protein
MEPFFRAARIGKDIAVELTDIIRRAWRDVEFKQQLLADSRAILERELGVTLPAGVQVYIHEQTPAEIHLILPPPPEQVEAEV